MIYVSSSEIFVGPPHDSLNITARASRCQAQLRGICVLCSGCYGLKEANFLEALAQGDDGWLTMCGAPVRYMVN